MKRMLVVLGGLMVVGCSGKAARHYPEPGLELYAVSPAGITDVVFTSDVRRVYAYRWRAEHPFTIVTASSADKAPESCTAGSGFEEWLKTLSQLHVVRRAPDSVVAGQAAWVSLELRDQTILEPVTVRLLRPAKPQDPVILQYADRHYEVKVPPSSLAGEDLTCAKLRAK